MFWINLIWKPICVSFMWCTECIFPCSVRALAACLRWNYWCASLSLALIIVFSCVLCDPWNTYFCVFCCAVKKLFDFHSPVDHLYQFLWLNSIQFTFSSRLFIPLQKGVSLKTWSCLWLYCAYGLLHAFQWSQFQWSQWSLKTFKTEPLTISLKYYLDTQ